MLPVGMAITAAFVVTASVITERSGPVIGALVATLPISAGPSYVFLALDHDAAFIAEGALASIPPSPRPIPWCDPCRAGAAAEPRSVGASAGRGVDRDGSILRAVHGLGPRPDRERDRVRDLCAAGAALSHVKMPLITRRRTTSRCGPAWSRPWWRTDGCHAYRTASGRPDQRHHRAVPLVVFTSMTMTLYRASGDPPTAAGREQRRGSMGL